jgi:hypothetical protein
VCWCALQSAAQLGLELHPELQVVIAVLCASPVRGEGGSKIGDEFFTFIVECKVKRMGVGGWWMRQSAVGSTGVANHIFFKLDG